MRLAAVEPPLDATFMTIMMANVNSSFMADVMEMKIILRPSSSVNLNVVGNVSLSVNLTVD